MSVSPLCSSALALLAAGCVEAPDPTAPAAPQPAAAVSAAASLAFREVSAGSYFTCGVTTDSIAYCWGLNAYGQLGNGSTASSSRPKLVPPPPGGTSPFRFTSVTTGGSHTCGLKPNGTSWCWGYGYYGQLGNGSQFKRINPIPIKVGGALTFKQLVAGGAHTCGLTTANVAYCWGYNHWGQLGDGGRSARLVPTAVAGGLAFASLSAGTNHACGVTTANIAYCWGLNLNGRLGTAITGTSDSLRVAPVRVTGGLTFVQLDAGGAHSCGRTPAGVAYCWGYNGQGQVGDATTASNRKTPTAVKDYGGTPPRVWGWLTAGEYHTCGTTANGTAPPTYCWGYNNYGQLGNNSLVNKNQPIRVYGSGFSLTRVDAGHSHTCGLTSANVAYCWGKNGDGELGDGTTADKIVPALVVPP